MGSNGQLSSKEGSPGPRMAPRGSWCRNRKDVGLSVVPENRGPVPPWRRRKFNGSGEQALGG